MNNITSIRLLVFIIAMVVAGGCAKKELVKNEEPITQIATTVQPAKTEPAVPSKPDALAVPSASGREETHESLTPILIAAELKYLLENIYFDFDAATLSPEARKALVKNVTIMKNEPSVIVRIEGHCDERGSDEYNLALGERRAKAALQYLVTMGISEKRVSTISYGKEKPTDSGHDEAAWAKNRRDEFVLQSK